MVDKMNREEKVFSVTMTEEELRLFSEFLEQREYSSKKKKNSEEDNDDLEDISVLDHRSKRGIGRSYLVGGAPGIVGRYTGINKYDNEIEDGSSEASARKSAMSHSAGVGAITGAGLGLISGSPISGAAYGAIGGALGIDKHVRSRHQKVREKRADEASKRFIEEHQKEYSKKEEKYLKQLRYEDPDKYLEEVRKYRNEKRAGGLIGSLAHPFAGRTVGNLVGLGIGASTGNFEDALGGTVAGGLSGLGAGFITGSAQAIHSAVKYSDNKTRKDTSSILEEKRLKKSDPEKYKALKEEQKDTVAVMNNLMDKSEFKRKWGHKPNTKI